MFQSQIQLHCEQGTLLHYRFVTNDMRQIYAEIWSSGRGDKCFENNFAESESHAADSTQTGIERDHL